MDALTKYSRRFATLRVDRSKGLPAPHKPILLLAVIEGIASGEITDNRIAITPELVARFKDYWHQLVHDPRFTPNFSLPFWHLQAKPETASFWHIQTIAGKLPVLTSSYSIRSFAHLKEVVAHAFLDNALYELLLTPLGREALKGTLLKTFFPSTTGLTNDSVLMEQLRDQVLHEAPAVYKLKSQTFDEEEVFIRGGVFKKEIPRLYNYTCCISGMRVIANKEVQLVDACHIVPFAASGDDTVGNGLSLCPNLHRAFDRGLIAIDDSYRVLVEAFAEIDGIYSIKQFAGKQVLLPASNQYWPLQENLAAHRKRFNF